MLWAMQVSWGKVQTEGVSEEIVRMSWEHFGVQGLVTRACPVMWDHVVPPAAPVSSSPHIQGDYVRKLSGPLRLRVQSRSRMRLRIAVSIAFLFRAYFKGVWDTIAPLSRG